MVDTQRLSSFGLRTLKKEGQVLGTLQRNGLSLGLLREAVASGGWVAGAPENYR